jgi:hypothetical protein
VRGPKRLVELRGGHNDAARVSRQIYVPELGAFLQKFLPGGHRDRSDQGA